MKKTLSILTMLSLSIFVNASDKVEITVSNPVKTSRIEVIEADFSLIKKKLNGAEKVIVKDADGKEIPSQITYDGKLIFKAGVGGKGKSQYFVSVGSPSQYEVHAKGRLFTERGDEFGWENDCVAYRIYGHGAAVGYDLFNKSTSELMLDYWYASEQNKEMRSVSKQLHDRGFHDLADQVYNAYCYHINHGKGMDCYTVGPTLGGGANALINADGSLFMPQCYKSFEILDKGPIRFTVKLVYPEQVYNGNKITETRIINLDEGSRFNKVTVSYSGLSAPAKMAAGTVVHKDNSSAYVLSTEGGYLGYEDLGDASVYNEKYRDELSKQMGKIYIGLLFPSTNITTSFQARENGIAVGHILATTTFQPSSSFTYYFGSGWSLNNETSFHTLQDWEKFLSQSSLEVRNKLKVTIK